MPRKEATPSPSTEPWTCPADVVTVMGTASAAGATASTERRRVYRGSIGRGLSVCGAERSKEIEMISKWTPLPAGVWVLSGPRDGWGSNGRRCQRGFGFWGWLGMRELDMQCVPK
jgi:hypothetical protein